jgi:hypothetical protein
VTGSTHVAGRHKSRVLSVQHSYQTDPSSWPVIGRERRIRLC